MGSKPRSGKRMCCSTICAEESNVPFFSATPSLLLLPCFIFLPPCQGSVSPVQETGLKSQWLQGVCCSGNASAFPGKTLHGQNLNSSP